MLNSGSIVKFKGAVVLNMRGWSIYARQRNTTTQKEEYETMEAGDVRAVLFSEASNCKCSLSIQNGEVRDMVLSMSEYVYHNELDGRMCGRSTRRVNSLTPLQWRKFAPSACLQVVACLRCRHITSIDAAKPNMDRCVFSCRVDDGINFYPQTLAIYKQCSSLLISCILEFR